MNWLNRLERKFGRYAINNLPKFIIIMYAIGAIINFINPYAYMTVLSLNPALILKGQIWRLGTFLLATPTNNIIFLIFMLLFYYTICTSLENVWGSFRFNMYILVGILGNIVASFLTYFITKNPNIYMDTYYLNLSLFLAYAACFPDMKVMLYFVIPIKIKWIAYLDVAYLIYEFFNVSIGGKISIIVALLNFLLFFFSTRDYKKVSPKEIHRKQVYKQEVKRASSVTRHKCAICGRTERDDPTLEFRFCSKCDGNYEYCQDHLFTHTHIKK